MTETARVLVTVKASPEPSSTYLETVCVAGVRLDRGSPEWIRLYPVPFRLLEGPNKFNKFEVVEVDVNRSTKDPRAESYRPVLDSIKPVQAPLSVKARGALLEPMVTNTMCGLRAGVQRDINGPSLGIIRPARVKTLLFERHPGWTAKQVGAMRNFASQPMLGAPGASPNLLEAPRFEVRYEYLCEELDCKGHKQRILDWELVAFERRLSKMADSEAKQKITERFYDMICSDEKRTHFFVGNFADAQKRKNFSVLGMYYPPAASDYGATLFDF